MGDSKLENPNRELKDNKKSHLYFVTIYIDSKLENPNRELKEVKVEIGKHVVSD